MAIWNTATRVRNHDFEGEQFARVEANTQKEAVEKVEAALQERGWETSDTFAREK
ncbi:hypothetical protein [Streptomyces sp. NPDC059258]|uniref:hypothetical protein n=1 Tax=unclassified Streptomyces TaxID=2593676 RepID=UPI00368ED436